jgi:hypothetical protein
MPKENQSEPDQPESEIRREESKEAERLLGTPVNRAFREIGSNLNKARSESGSLLV